MNREPMKTCLKCQSINPDDARFCYECGFTFSAQGQPHNLCPVGKHPIDLTWTSCPYCSGFQPAFDPSAQTALLAQSAPAAMTALAVRTALSPETFIPPVAGGRKCPSATMKRQPDPAQNPTFRRGIVVGNWIIEGKIG